MNLHWICRERAVQGVALALALQLAAYPAAGQTIPAKLDIVAVRGDGAIARVGERASQDVLIRLVDEAREPVSGAAVVFTLPTEGATGVFTNGSRTLMTLTDREGSATATGLRFNGIPGKVIIHVTASYKGASASTTIAQISQAPAGYKPRSGSHTGRIVAILAAIGAAGAGGA